MPAQQHHYVPQFHLRQWGLTDRGPIGVLDKSNGRIFKANPRDVGGEKFFHSKLPEAQVIEDWFADLEAKASKLFAKIADRTDLAAINRHERLDLCQFIAAALVRTRESREEVVQMAEGLMNEIAREMGVTDWTVRLTEAGALGYHLNTFTSISQYAAILLGLRMILLVNETGLALTTSDHPVVRHNDLPPRPHGGGRLGFKSPGFQLHMPISPKLCLLLLDPAAFGSLPGRLVLADTKDVIFERELQLSQSFRHVFGPPHDMFANELTILKEHPDIADPGRQRIQLDSGPSATHPRRVLLHGYNKGRGSAPREQSE